MLVGDCRVSLTLSVLRELYVLILVGKRSQCVSPVRTDGIRVGWDVVVLTWSAGVKMLQSP